LSVPRYPPFVTCVLATRGRPQMLMDTVKETLRHVVLPDTRILVAADADDHGTLCALHAFANEPRVIASVRDREDDLGSKFNRALEEAPADVYAHMVDYAPFVTPGFDRNLIEVAAQIPDNIGVINCRMPTLCFTASQGITHGFAKQLGYIYPAYFPYWFIDHWVDDVARLTGRLFYADNTVDTSRRPGTQNLREPGWWASFFDVMAGERRKQALRIIRSEGFASPDWQKELLIAAFPLLEQRSRWINDRVREEAGRVTTGLGAGPGDERYARLKAQAVAMLKAEIDEAEGAEKAA
jgi:hypothetical protein